jgi:BlaI family transcriptional regulator, penicillinase repressor
MEVSAMSIPKITDGELKILEILWKKAPIAAIDIVAELRENANWNKNTTYTFINRLVDKKVISRTNPGFICEPLFSENEIKISETHNFLNKIFNGSFKMLVTSFVDGKELSDEEIAEIKKIIDK